jgi:hypothetical protein
VATSISIIRPGFSPALGRTAFGVLAMWSILPMNTADLRERQAKMCNQNLSLIRFTPQVIKIVGKKPIKNLESTIY